MTNKVILTGIKPSGMPHLGNYCGAIKPMVEQVNNKSENETIHMFIPDIHVINGGLEPAKIREFTYGMLATYLACGLDPSKVVIYRQSAIRQHAELATLLNNLTPKGMMNRAHSYKAAVDKNSDKLNINIDGVDDDITLLDIIFDVVQILKRLEHELGFDLLPEETIEEVKVYIDLLSRVHLEDVYIQVLLNNLIKDINTISSQISELEVDRLKQLALDICRLLLTNDSGINMGLYTYPILMASDILLYHTNIVPVGKDQIQHIEMARDIANSFNHRYSDTFTLPNYESKEDAPEISGLDGRKMSKSYGNHIPMFCNEMELKSLVKKIITDSALPDEEKDVEGSTLVQLYELFADEAKALDYKTRLAAGGFGYGDAKNELYELLNTELSEKRAKYNELMKDRKALEEILREGEEQARRMAEKTMRKVRKKMGLVESI